MNKIIPFISLLAIRIARAGGLKQFFLRKTLCFRGTKCNNDLLHRAFAADKTIAKHLFNGFTTFDINSKITVLHDLFPDFQVQKGALNSRFFDIKALYMNFYGALMPLVMAHDFRRWHVRVNWR